MKVVFADTGYRAAVLNPRDTLHDRTRRVSASLGKVRILTTEMVLDELLATLSAAPLRPFAMKGVDAIRSDPGCRGRAATSLDSTPRSIGIARDRRGIGA